MVSFTMSTPVLNASHPKLGDQNNVPEESVNRTVSVNLLPLSWIYTEGGVTDFFNLLTRKLEKF